MVGYNLVEHQSEAVRLWNKAHVYVYNAPQNGNDVKKILFSLAVKMTKLKNVKFAKACEMETAQVLHSHGHFQ